MSLDRWVRFPARTILKVLAIVIAVWAVLQIVAIARHVLTWILVALFFALALNPVVDWLEGRVRRRLLAVGITYVAALAAVAAVAALFLPTVIDETNAFAEALPGYVDELTRGEGPLGFLQEDYQVVDKVQDAVRDGGAAKVLGFSGAALTVTKSVLTMIVAIVTIFFLTFFMLLEGRQWVERAYSLVPPESEERWRTVGRDVYRTVGGYVSGNLLISLIAGVVTSIVLSIVGVPYAIALGLLVAILDLIPLAGATIAAILVGTIAFLDGVTSGVIVVAFFLVYQQIENHILYPIVYSRTVQPSPLVVLIAVLIGAELAGVLRAFGAIPVAGTLHVVIRDYLGHRPQSAARDVAHVTSQGPAPPEPAP